MKFMPVNSIHKMFSTKKYVSDTMDFKVHTNMTFQSFNVSLVVKLSAISILYKSSTAFLKCLYIQQKMQLM